jgi:electron transfer flavoprotein alpha/beta subunit
VLSPAFGGADVTVWNHDGLAHVLTVGDPVALHSVYNVLAVGAHRLSVVAH